MSKARQLNMGAQHVTNEDMALLDSRCVAGRGSNHMVNEWLEVTARAA
jgi:hypothetical protein